MQLSSYSSELLPVSFLEKYVNKQPNWGFNGLGYVVYKRTYSRKLDDGETSEEWWQTVARCINGAQKIGANYTPEEAQRLFDYIFNLKANFAGRMLWQLGTPLVDRFFANSLLNCLSGDTLVLTREGWKPIAELAGKTATIVTKNGKWVEAPFYCFGEQETYEVVFRSKSGKETIVRATADHRWFVFDKNHNHIETTTVNLKPGDVVPVVRGKNSTKRLSPQGIQHGIVYGDGSCNGMHSFVDLIGKKIDYLSKYFVLNEKYQIKDNHVRFIGMPNYYKQLPDINENKEYLMGFLAGWLATDGYVHKTNGSIRLFNKSKDVLEFARNVAAVLGFRTTEPILERNYNPFDKNKSSELWSIAFSKFDNPDVLLIRDDHIENYGNNKNTKKIYDNSVKVVSVTPTNKVEPVYCTVVPETHSFVIDGNILTGNCWYVSINSIDSFCFLFENLMLGGGVGFSVRREHVYQLPKVKKNVVVKHEATKDADFIVPDSREGWVRLLRMVLKSYFETGESFTYSTILVRGYGEPIKGFGGTASGPQILIEGIDGISKILKNREGKKIRSIDALDICNIIGSVVVSGNIRRCVGNGAVVRTKDGYKTIENVKVGDFVLTEDGTFKEVIDHVYQGKQKTVKIITPYNELVCTPDHRVAVMKSLSEVEWKQAQDLKKDDRLVVVVNHEGNKIDTEFAYILGYFLGNGHADIESSKRRNGGGGVICVTGNKTRPQDYVIFEKIKNYIERNFDGATCKIYEAKNTNSLRLVCYKKDVAEFFLQYKKAKTEFQIPEFVLNADIEGKAAFVAGLMDSDGDNTTKNVIVNNKYPNFLKKLQQMLLDIGIVTNRVIRERTINEKKCIFGYLSISGIESQKIAQKYIGKYLMRCQICVKEAPKNGPSIPAYILENSGVSKTIINNLTSSSKTGKPRRDANLHSVFELEGYKINKNWIPIPVVDVVEHEEVDTYDISVRENSNFMVNNMLVHNTAQIALGDPDDYLYLRAKRWDLGNIPNWRAMSNNTLYIDDYSYIQDQVWDGYNGNGEPYGFFNLPLSQEYGRLGEKFQDNCDGLNPCGEITLSNYECCNLCELYLPNIESKEEMLDIAKLLYKTQKAVAAMKYIHKETEEVVHKNMRLGLGITGICQSLDKLEWCDYVYRELRKFDKEWSKERGWNRSIKLTTVKPSGTLSLLAGVTPGVHPGYSHYFIRRVRMSSSDPLVHYCKNLGFKVEYVKNFDGSEDRKTVVVEFPCKYDENTVVAHQMKAVDQLELVKKMQTIWSDNAVSCTVYYRKEELPEIKEWLKNNYESSIKSVSFLLHSDHGFIQAPYEEISKEKYEELVKKVKPIITMNVSSGEDLDGLECSTGVCPIK